MDRGRAGGATLLIGTAPSNQRLVLVFDSIPPPTPTLTYLGFHYYFLQLRRSDFIDEFREIQKPSIKSRPSW